MKKLVARLAISERLIGRSIAQLLFNSERHLDTERDFEAVRLHLASSRSIVRKLSRSKIPEVSEACSETGIMIEETEHHLNRLEAEIAARQPN